MKKPAIYILTGLFVVLLTACSSSDSGDSSDAAGLMSDGTDAVVFSTDVNNQTTRATTGTINTIDDLKNAEEGFGVFAYHTDETAYDTKFSGGFTDFSDFFMYNQQVRWSVQYVDDSNVNQYDWVYSPLKYWPNSTGNVTSRYVSFFAYAPYIDVTGNESGVVNYTRENDRSPHVIYKIGSPTEQVDLLYANCKDATRNGQGLISVSTVDDVTTLTYQKVPLVFQHALAAIDIYVQRVYDEPAYTGKKPDTEQNTKLFISKLELKSTGKDGSGKNNLQLGGKLNLATGEWSDPGAPAAGETDTQWSTADNVTLTYSEGSFVESVRGTVSTNSLVIMDTELDKWKTDTYGVNEKETYLIKDNMSQMMLPRKVTLIPTMTYSMVTRDDDLTVNYLTDSENHRYARIINEVTGNSLTLDLVAGKRYVLLLRISAEHISFELMSVIDWDFPIRFTPSVVSDFKDDVIGHRVDEE